jgi:hypothetical protein
MNGYRITEEQKAMTRTEREQNKINCRKLQRKIHKHKIRVIMIISVLNMFYVLVSSVTSQFSCMFLYSCSHYLLTLCHRSLLLLAFLYLAILRLFMSVHILSCPIMPVHFPFALFLCFCIMPHPSCPIMSHHVRSLSVHVLLSFSPCPIMSVHCPFALFLTFVLKWLPCPIIPGCSRARRRL